MVELYLAAAEAVARWRLERIEDFSSMASCMTGGRGVPAFYRSSTSRGPWASMNAHQLQSLYNCSGLAV